MRSAHEIVDEHLGGPFHLLDVYKIVERAQREALEEAIAEASAACGCCPEMLNAIEALIPERDTKDKIVDTLKDKEKS